MNVNEDLSTGLNARTKDLDIPWLINCTLITVVAAFLRFFDLALKPFHHDEGVNGFFLNTLVKDGVYKYDPANYHGPTLYYISLFFSKVFGLNTVSVRASVAIFGVLMVVLAFYLRPFIGKFGALAAGLFLALSPGMVFISRYFIHEIFFVFLALALVLSILYFIRNKQAGPFAAAWMVLLLMVCFVPSGLMIANYFGGESTAAQWAIRILIVAAEAVLMFFVMRMLLEWNGGRPIYLLLASASAALMFATKETAFITLGTMLIALPCIWIWRKIYGVKGEGAETLEDDDQITWQNFRYAAGQGNDLLVLAAAVAGMFVYVNVLFFSSFFTYPEGVQKAFEAYAIWTKTGTKDHTQSGFWGYIRWFFGYGQTSSALKTAVEGAIVLLSGIGTLIAFLKGRYRVAMFIALWALGLFLAYSLIPYKTPWLALSFLLPMCLIAGYGVNEMIGSRNTVLRIAGAVLGAAAAGLLAFQAYDLNFVNYDNNDRTYVYAHTKREFLTMMERIDHYATKSGKGQQTAIDVISPDYWPMVWYTKDYPKAVYHGRMTDNSSAEVIVAKKTDQDRELMARYASRYRLDGVYPLRPGVDLVLLVRNDIADEGTSEVFRLTSY
ncbi:MAG: phospholipid carrier-dependent glycosyltransferase [Pyrinomonadaceae bacterium]